MEFPTLSNPRASPILARAPPKHAHLQAQCAALVPQVPLQPRFASPVLTGPSSRLQQPEARAQTFGCCACQRRCPAGELPGEATSPDSRSCERVYPQLKSTQPAPSWGWVCARLPVACQLVFGYCCTQPSVLVQEGCGARANRRAVRLARGSSDLLAGKTMAYRRSSQHQIEAPRYRILPFRFFKCMNSSMEFLLRAGDTPDRRMKIGECSSSVPRIVRGIVPR